MVIIIFLGSDKMRTNKFSLKLENNKKAFKLGLKEGLPIGLGYFAVSFSLGIMASKSGLTAFQAMLASLLCNASAGEYIGFTLIGAGASILELAVAIFIANARYLLMSCSLSQKFDPEMAFHHRLFIGFDVTDEIFGITISKPGYVNPNHTYAAMLVSIPLWALGTMLGVIAGNIMPLRLVSALSVALYGMFLAVIIPPAKKSLKLTLVILTCFVIGFISNYIPVFKDLADGTKIMILTIIIASLAAIIFPVKDNKEESQND